MIERLDWDSKFFGYEVGKLEIKDPSSFNPYNLPDLTCKFKLVYLFSKEKLNDNVNLVPVDIKTVLTRQTEHYPEDFSFIRSYKGSVTEQLINLALQSGEYSRFNTDSAFKNGEFAKLYIEWIKNSVNHRLATDVFVYDEINEIQGFITLGFKNNSGDIGLIAVDSKCRGKGIGSMLVRYVINKAYSLGYKEIKVTTQFENKSALALYTRNGFKISDLTWIYHFRNK